MTKLGVMSNGNSVVGMVRVGGVVVGAAALIMSAGRPVVATAGPAGKVAAERVMLSMIATEAARDALAIDVVGEVVA